MSNFWIVNKKNFFTPALLFFAFISSTYLFSIPLRVGSDLYQSMFILIIFIFSISLFIFNYFLIQKNFLNLNNLYIIANTFFIGVCVFFLTKAAENFSLTVYPANFLTNLLAANVVVLIQLSVNQEIKKLRANLILFYILCFITVMYLIRFDIINVLNDTTIRLHQVTAFFLICLEIFRLFDFSKYLNEIIDKE